jgi:hypothetical protein
VLCVYLLSLHVVCIVLYIETGLASDSYSSIHTVVRITSDAQCHSALRSCVLAVPILQHEHTVASHFTVQCLLADVRTYTHTTDVGLCVARGSL